MDTNKEKIKQDVYAYKNEYQKIIYNSYKKEISESKYGIELKKIIE